MTTEGEAIHVASDDDMPAGTIGFEAIGEVEDDDWEETVEPVLRQEIADGREVRLLYLIGREAREVEGDAMSADAGFRARHARPSSGSRWSATRTGCARRCAPFPSSDSNTPQRSTEEE